jgi:hypothetical protein
MDLDNDEAAPNGKEPEADTAKTGVPQWIRTTAAFVGLIGAAAGIGVSIYGLVLKAKTDKETASINKEIALDQLKARQQEDRDQKIQHDLDQMAQREEIKREDQAKKSERLQTIISEIFVSPRDAEGKIEVLSTFIEPDHRYDVLIGNAIEARLQDCQSESEVALSFQVLQKLGIPKAPLLTAINQSSRRRFDNSLIRRFWFTLRAQAMTDSFIGQDRSTRGPALGNEDVHTLSPGHKLFNLASDAEDKLARDLATEEDFIDKDYIYATINGALRLSLRPDFDPFEEASHPPEKDGGWARHIMQKMDEQMSGGFVVPGGQTYQAAIQDATDVSFNILQRTAALLPAALHEERAKFNGRAVSLEGSYFPTQRTWPKGAYLTIDFGGANVTTQVFSEVQFDHATRQSFRHTQIVVRDSRFSEWEKGEYSSSPLDREFFFPAAPGWVPPTLASDR